MDSQTHHTVCGWFDEIEALLQEIHETAKESLDSPGPEETKKLQSAVRHSKLDSIQSLIDEMPDNV